MRLAAGQKASNVSGKPENVPIASYPNVDQFWPFTEAEIESFKNGYKDSLATCGLVNFICPSTAPTISIGDMPPISAQMCFQLCARA